MRAAASSIASGNPSSRWQISLTASAFSIVKVKAIPALRGGHEERDRRRVAKSVSQVSDR